MATLENIVERSYLYDFYGELLTDHQKAIYEAFVFENYSLSEIADENGISRQGVHDLIRRCDKQLDEYEKNLHLVERFQALRRQTEELIGILEGTEDSDSKVKDATQKARTLLEEL